MIRQPQPSFLILFVVAAVSLSVGCAGLSKPREPFTGNPLGNGPQASQLIGKWSPVDEDDSIPSHELEFESNGEFRISEAGRMRALMDGDWVTDGDRIMFHARSARDEDVCSLPAVYQFRIGSAGGADILTLIRIGDKCESRVQQLVHSWQRSG